MIKKEEKITRFPENKQVEFSVISLLLKHKSNVEKASIFNLVEEDFYDTNCKNIYKSILQLNKLNSAIDINTVHTRLKENNTNIEYQSLVKLIQAKVESSNILEDYIFILKDLSKERKLIEISDSIKELAHVGDVTTDEKYNSIMNMFNETSTVMSSNMETETKSYLSFLDNLDNRIKNKGVENLTWGLKTLDNEFGGINPDLYIIAAPPGGFKTSYLDIIISKNSQKGKNILFFTTEMATEQVILRKIQRELGINSNDIRKGDITKDEYKQIQAFKNELKDNIVYDETPSIDIDLLTLKAKMEHRKKPLDLVCVDYLQLCSCRRMKTRYDEISEISRCLKKLSKELKCPVIALSQLNRNPNNRADGKPILSDLRESGQIEQDASGIIFLHVAKTDKPTNMKDRAEKMEVIIAKNRYGAITTFQADLTRSRLLIEDSVDFTNSGFNSVKPIHFVADPFGDNDD